MLRFFLRGEFAGQLASFGGETATGSLLRVVELLLRGAFRVSHNKPKLTFPEGVVNKDLGVTNRARAAAQRPAAVNNFVNK